MIPSMAHSEFPPNAALVAPTRKHGTTIEQAMPWSESLQRQTRAAIEELSIPPDGLLHMKHKVLGYAAMHALELLQGQLVCRSKDRNSWEYPNVESLLTSGWAID